MSNVRWVRTGAHPEHCQHREKLWFLDNDWFIQGKIAIFLCPSLTDWSWQASIKLKRVMKVNIQMFLPGLGILHCCNYRAHTGMMIGPETGVARGQITVHLQILGRRVPFKARSPAGAAKTSQPREEHAGELPASGQGAADWGQTLVTFKAHWIQMVTADVYNEGCLGRKPLALQGDQWETRLKYQG